MYNSEDKPITAEELSNILYDITDIDCEWLMDTIKEKLSNRPIEEIIEVLLYKNRLGHNITLYNLPFCIFKEENIEYFMKYIRLIPSEVIYNYRDIYNSTVLHNAAYASNKVFMMKLLKLGIDKNVKGKFNETVESILQKKINDAQKIVNLNNEIITCVSIP